MKEISPINFFKIYQRNNNFKVIDIREVNEYEKYHISDTINIPYKLLIDKHYLFLNKSHQYYIICKNGALSYQITLELDRLGYHVTNIVGGIDKWPGILKSYEFYS